MFDINDYIALVVLGLIAGASGGLLGIGGSTVMIPGMVVLFGAGQQHLYQAAAMIVNFFVVAPAVLRHWQVRATLRPITRWTVPSSVVGALAGVFLSELPQFAGAGQGYLQIVFSLFLAYAVLYNLLRLQSKQRLPKMDEQDATKLSRFKIIALVGLPAGLAGGLLGVGGGLVAVPAQQVFLSVPLTNAIANSASTILWSSVIGAVVKNTSLTRHGFTIGQSCLIAACLIPSAMIGSWFTSAKVHRWPVGIVRWAFVLLMVYCGIQIFRAGLAQLRAGGAIGTVGPALIQYSGEERALAKNDIEIPRR
ncbi:MAG: sulfite exporter TauE/SafE family protein [Planctomycetota bacterium]